MSSSRASGGTPIDKDGTTVVLVDRVRYGVAAAVVAHKDARSATPAGSEACHLEGRRFQGKTRTTGEPGRRS